MWGPWMGITVGGLVVVLLLIGIAFGTSALLFPVLIAAVIAVGIAAVYVLGRVGSRPGGTTPDPVRDSAPASGQGEAAAPRDLGGPDPSGVR
jgi:hypothetical protein